MSVTPLDDTRLPEATSLLEQIGRGMIPSPELIVAAVEAYPGPTPDWRSLLVTESLKSALGTLGIRRGESAVIASRQSTSREMGRYQRSGWRPYRVDDLMMGVMGESDYRRCLEKSAPRQRQQQVKKMLHDMSAPASALWPVMRTLDAFYASDDARPGRQHLTGWARNEDDVVRWAGMLWDKQVADPIGSGLGLSRDAMPKYWQQRHGGVWPDMAPDLPPKLIVVAQAEELSPSELRILASQPCPVLCFGDPAIGVQGAALGDLNTQPLGSHVLGEMHATTLGCEEGLERAIRHVIRNDVDVPDAWVQTVGALSSVSLDRTRPGFDTFRRLTHTPDERPRHAPLSAPGVRPNALVSRTGLSAIRHVLDAMRPPSKLPVEDRPRLKIHMDAPFSRLVKDAHEVAQIYYLPEERWDQQLRQRYRKGKEAALDMCAKSADKGALLELFRQRDDPALAGVLKMLSNIEYRGTRIIHASGLKDAEQADGHETTLHIGDPPDMHGLKGRPVTIVDAELSSSGTGQSQAACLYRALSQRPVDISPTSEEAIEFIERAHDWIAEKRRSRDAEPVMTATASPSPQETPAADQETSTPSQASPTAHQGHAPSGEEPPADTQGSPAETQVSPAPDEEPQAPPGSPEAQEAPVASAPADAPPEGAADHPAKMHRPAGAPPEHGGHRPVEHAGESHPEERRAFSSIPPALEEWDTERLDELEMMEGARDAWDLDHALQEYRQDAAPPVPPALSESSIESTAPDKPAYEAAPEQEAPEQPAEGNSEMSAEQEKGQSRQAALREAWGAATAEMLKRKSDNPSPPVSTSRGPSLGG